MPDLTPDEFRALGHLFVDAVADARAGLSRHPVRDVVEPGTVRARFDREAAEDPAPLAGFPALVEAVTGDADTRWQHPGFHAWFPANASLTSLLGDLLAGGAGTQGMLWSSSPACTEVEQAITDQLARGLGLPEGFTHDGGGGGAIQDSASSAALVALAAALHRAAPDPETGWRARGVTGRERVYVSPETHSSLAKAARVSGLGAAGLHTVPCTAGTRSLDPAALATAMASDVDAGLVPVLVCATVGTTSTGSVDPVAAITGVAAAHGAWVHVDAAWAGAAALCPEHRWLLDGVDRADSFCTDAHKWLFTAFDASLLWVRDPAALPAALSITPAYLRDAASDSGAVVDLRDWQIPLGRRFRALKLWAVLHGQGLAGLRAHLRGHVALATELAARIRAHDGLELACAPMLSLVCLRVPGDDAATVALLERANADGRVLLSGTEIDGRPAVRVAFGALGTGPAELDVLWDILCGLS